MDKPSPLPCRLGKSLGCLIRIEFVENELVVFRVDADAGVLDLEAEISVRFREDDVDRPLAREFQGVGNQVHRHLAVHRDIGHQRDVRHFSGELELHAPFPGVGLVERHQFGRVGHDVHGLEIRLQFRGLDAGDRQ
jgi:hypothetical protein